MRLGVGASLLIWGANFAIAPGSCEIPNEVIEFPSCWSRFGGGSCFETSYFFLELSEADSKAPADPASRTAFEDAPSLRRPLFISKQLFIWGGRRMILFDHFAAFPRFGLELERGLEEVDV